MNKVAKIEKNTKTSTKKELPKNEYAVFSKIVPVQAGDIYKVLSMGTCVEFTDRLSEAQAAYKEASKPKQMFKVLRAGGVLKLHDEMI